MPLTDFIRYLNAQLPFSHSHLQLASPFYSLDGRVVVSYRHLHLESGFLPIVDAASGEVRGHAAHLLASARQGAPAMSESTVFVLPESDEEFIFLDRLVRTLHTLNYLVHLDRQSRGLLLLKVHPRHVASVSSDHGLAFEEILRACGLLPDEIILELRTHENVDVEHFARAADNYKGRGYGVALAGGDWRPPPLELARRVRPSIVSLERPIRFLKSLRRQVDNLHALDIAVLVHCAGRPLSTSHLAAGVYDLRTELPRRRLLAAS